MTHVYDVRERKYLEAAKEDSYPSSIYDMYSESEIDWDIDVSALDAEVTAVFSPSTGSREAAQDLCRDHGDDPALYEKFEAFLSDGRFDAALVCSPQHHHADAVVPLLERDFDVFCEKPLAHTLEDHDRIIAAEDNSSVMLYVGLQRRVSPFARRVKELIDGGTIGRLNMISRTEVRDPFRNSHPGEKGYRYSQEESGGALLEKNVHAFDQYNWYTGRDPIKVTAVGGQHVLNRNTDIVDHAVVTVQYEDGIVASLELCLYLGPDERDIYDVRVRSETEYRGSDGLLQIPSEPGIIDIDTREEQRRVDVGMEEGAGHSGDRYEASRLLRCLAGNATPPATSTDAKKAAAIAFAAERSIREDGAIVEISDEYDLID
jgi:predicted dehydrogenase